MPKYVFNEDFFEKIDTEHKAYWLGFLYADGCILDMRLHDGTKVPQTVQISISIKDIEIIYKFMKDIELEKNIYIGVAHNKKSDTQYARVQVGSSKMCRDLISHGCTPRKTLTLTFPTENDVPNELIRHFIRGYFDGDGSVYFCERMQFDKHCGYERLQQNFCGNFQGTMDFLKKLEFILNSNGVVTRPIRTGHGQIYSLDFGRRDAMVSFYHFLYDDATIYLNRKHQKFLDIFKYLNMVF